MKVLSTVLFLATATSGLLLAQGPLTPPGAPAPTMKTLDQIEPRTPISSLPFTITQPGSYYMTQNLHFTAATGNAITIQVSDVTLDLGGFVLSSSSAVTGTAIAVQSSLSGHRIRNGTILGTTTVTVTGSGTTTVVNKVPGGFNYGISAQENCLCTDLTLRGCRQDGFRGLSHAICERVHAQSNGQYGVVDAQGTGSSATGCTAVSNGLRGISGFGVVSRCSALENGSTGLSADVVTGSSARSNGGGIAGNTVSDCMASNNFGNGIAADTVSNCTTLSNTGDGITTVTGTVVRGCVTGCISDQNDGWGIRAGVVSRCSASSNARSGIGLEANNIGTHAQGSASDCLANSNSGAGIFGSAGSVIRNCTARDNAGPGIQALDGCSILDNTCTSNVRHGIQVTSESQIRGNTCDKNGSSTFTAAGIHTTGGDNRIEDNTCTENDRGLEITNSGSLIIRNTCAANVLANYEIAASNRVGPIISAPLSPAISGSTGGDGVGSTNPWANFSF